jgi:hypothetical protein
MRHLRQWANQLQQLRFKITNGNFMVLGLRFYALHFRLCRWNMLIVHRWSEQLSYLRVGLNKAQQH